MKKLLPIIIGLIALALVAEAFLFFTEKTQEKRQAEAIKAQESADSLKYAKEHMLTLTDTLLQFSSVLEKNQIYAELLESGIVNGFGARFHISDIDIYHNDQTKKTYFVCKGREEEAFSYLIGNRGLELKYSSPTQSKPGCFTYRVEDLGEYFKENLLSREQLNTALPILNHFKDRVSAYDKEPIVIKAIPSKYINEYGAFVPLDSVKYAQPLPQKAPPTREESQRFIPASGGESAGFDFKKNDGKNQ